jgi:hypothetical protein
MTSEQEARVAVGEALVRLNHAWETLTGFTAQGAPPANGSPKDPGIPAKQVSWCFVCDDTIDINERIVRRADSEGVKRWMHAECQQ